MAQQESRVGAGGGGRGPTDTCYNILEFMSVICKPFTQLDPAQFFLKPASGFFLHRFLGVVFFVFFFYWHCPKMRCAILTRLVERCLVSFQLVKSSWCTLILGPFDNVTIIGIVYRFILPLLLPSSIVFPCAETSVFAVFISISIWISLCFMCCCFSLDSYYNNVSSRGCVVRGEGVLFAYHQL